MPVKWRTQFEKNIFLSFMRTKNIRLMNMHIEGKKMFTYHSFNKEREKERARYIFIYNSIKKEL